MGGAFAPFYIYLAWRPPTEETMETNVGENKNSGLFFNSITLRKSGCNE